jgi:uncharacterized membrane protein YqjE
MDPQELPGGIPSRISGLTAALLRHLLALGALAAEETRQLIRQSLAGLLLLISLILSLFLCYLGGMAALISLLALDLHWGWPSSLAASALFHLALAAILFVVLKFTSLPSPYQATSAELQRDIEALGKHSHRP